MAAISLKLLGDSVSLERAFRRANRAGTGFNKNMGQVSRGAAGASFGFRGLGRTVAFASASFLGGAGAIVALKSTSAAASNMAEQLSKSRVVFGDSSTVVENYAKNALGLANDAALEITGTFGALLRPLGYLPAAAADTSVQLAKLGVDLASFSNTPVPEALDAIRSGLVGESEPLRRYGVQLSEARVQQLAMATTGKKTVKSLTNQEKTAARLAIIMRDSSLAQGDFARTSGGLANQQKTLAANVRNLQIAVGTALNPAILSVTTSLNKWLSSSKNQQSVLSTVKGVIAGVAVVARNLRSAFGALNSITGSTKNTVVLLIGVFAAFKALKLALFIAAVIGRMRALSAAATVATGNVGKLTGSLKLMRLALASPFVIAIVGAAAIGAALVLARKFKEAQEGMLAAQNRALAPGSGAEKTLVPTLAADIDRLRAGGKTMEQIITTLRARLGGSLIADDLIGKAIKESTVPAGLRAKDRAEGNRPELAKAAAAKIKKDADTVKKTLGKSATELAQQRNNWFDALIGRRLDRVQDITGETGQISALGKIAAQIRARIAATKDITRRMALEDQLLDIVRQQRGLRAEKAEKDKSAREEAVARRKELAEAAKTARIAQQFRTLGLTAEGGERTPGKANLKKQLGSLAQNVKGTILDTGKTRSMLARIRKVLSEGIVPDDVRAKIAEMLAGLRDQLRDGPKKAARPFVKANSNAILAGLGLSPEQLKIARSRLSQLGAGGTVPGARTAAFAGAGGGAPIVVHTSVNLDGQVVAKNTTNHQRKAAKRRATSRRGPSAGR